MKAKLNSLPKVKIIEKIKGSLFYFNKLPVSQKVSVALLSLLLLTVLLGVFSVVSPNSLFFPCSKKPATAPGKPAFINWRTDMVSLKSRGFYIKTDGVVYHDNNDTVIIQSGPGGLTDTTLEAIWYENNREMRVFIYFAADANEWWADEIRTYNGQVRGDWIFYYGDFFRTPIGSAYTGNVTLRTDKNSPHKGMIRFQGLELQAFLNR